jgi:uncharacterized protein
MKLHEMESLKIYQGMALMADPIYQYTSFTVPMTDTPRGEKTEKDLIDSPWMQRLRRIYQLQSARWVYPSAEHTRFQHALGTMHLAGEFGKALYPSLCEVAHHVPSLSYIEEILRIAGLLHDVGHGPYGHFFDDNFLDQYGLTHEDIGKEIIVRKLGRIIRHIRRSPSGHLSDCETLDPYQIAFLIKSPRERREEAPDWLMLLRQLFSGIYTVDNLDYVQRDAYMTGFSLDIVDVDRLRYYNFFTDDGLTLHQAGLSALSRFLNARLNLYANVYFHRTTRALDLHLQEIFRDTMVFIFGHNPLEALDNYLDLDEWHLFHTVRGWHSDDNAFKRRLGREWEKLYNRQVKWKMSYSTEFSVGQLQKGTRFSDALDYESQVRRYLPKSLKNVALRVDLATQDPRPVNPMSHTDKSVNIFNPATGCTSREPLKDIYRFIPARVVHFRIFALNHHHDRELTIAAERTLEELRDVSLTNI